MANKNKYELDPYERETIILMNEADEQAELFTYNRKLHRRMRDLMKKCPSLVHFQKENGAGGRTYAFPKEWVKIQPSLVRSERQRAHLERITRERMEKNTDRREMKTDGGTESENLTI